MGDISDEDLMTSSQAAIMIGISEHLLRTMRSKDKGPTYLKIGKAVRYHRKHVYEYLDSIVPKQPEPNLGNRISELETRLEKLENKLRRDLDDEALSISRLISKNTSNI